MSADQQDVLKALQQWAYPFPMAGSSSRQGPDDYLKAFSGGDGSYPLGVNGLWHGGVHFGDATASMLDQSGGVRCIADGEVVAYRLKSVFTQITYPKDEKGIYSLGFTLVRHKLTLPAAPTNQPTSSSGPSNAPSPNSATQTNTLSTDPADSLTFFSLYMHLAPYASYKATPQNTWPHYYAVTNIYTVSTNANDTQEVPAGSKVQPIIGAHVHADNGNKNKPGPGKRIGIVPQGQQLIVTLPPHGPKHWGRIVSTAEPNVIVPIVPGTSVVPEASTGWIFMGEKWLTSEKKPDALDTIHILSNPVTISAGDMIGYLGEYQNLRDATPLPAIPVRPLTHVEVFAGTDFPVFLQRSRQRAALLTNEPNTQIIIAPGAIAYSDAMPTGQLPASTSVATTADSPKEGKWIKVKVTNGTLANTTCWILRSALNSAAARNKWDSFPISTSETPTNACAYTRVINIAQSPGNGDDAGNTWHEVDFGDAQMHTQTGYVRAPGPNVTLANKWAWAGFETLSSALTPSDLFKRELYLKDAPTTPTEKSTFETAFESAKSDTLIQKLDAIATSSNQPKGRVRGQALLWALDTPWQGNLIDHLIIKYESEWGGNAAKWDALDGLMNNGLAHWAAEKKRIEALQIWDTLSGASPAVLPNDASVYHVHPIGLVGAFQLPHRRHDYDLGKLSSHFETGGKGPITISGGVGDPGGVSYGSYQMTSQTMTSNGQILVGGTVKLFVTGNDFPWCQNFANLTPGTPAFSAMWKQIVSANEEEFTKIEHRYIRATHFDIQIETILKNTNVDLRYHSHAINDVVWSAAVQHGPKTGIIWKSIKELSESPSETKLYDSKLINAIYEERGRKDSSGKMIHFPSSSKKEQKGVADRYADEVKKAQKELSDENF